MADSEKTPASAPAPAAASEPAAVATVSVSAKVSNEPGLDTASISVPSSPTAAAGTSASIDIGGTTPKNSATATTGGGNSTAATPTNGATATAATTTVLPPVTPSQPVAETNANPFLIRFAVSRDVHTPTDLKRPSRPTTRPSTSHGTGTAASTAQSPAQPASARAATSMTSPRRRRPQHAYHAHDALSSPRRPATSGSASGRRSASPNRAFAYGTPSPVQPTGVVPHTMGPRQSSKKFIPPYEQKRNMTVPVRRTWTNGRPTQIGDISEQHAKQRTLKQFQLLLDNRKRTAEERVRQIQAEVFGTPLQKKKPHPLIAAISPPRAVASGSDTHKIDPSLLLPLPPLPDSDDDENAKGGEDQKHSSSGAKGSKRKPAAVKKVDRHPKDARLGLRTTDTIKGGSSKNGKSKSAKPAPELTAEQTAALKWFVELDRASRRTDDLGAVDYSALNWTGEQKQTLLRKKTPAEIEALNAYKKEKAAVAAEERKAREAAEREAKRIAAEKLKEKQKQAQIELEYKKKLDDDAAKAEAARLEEEKRRNEAFKEQLKRTFAEEARALKEKRAKQQKEEDDKRKARENEEALEAAMRAAGVKAQSAPSYLKGTVSAARNMRSLAGADEILEKAKAAKERRAEVHQVSLQAHASVRVSENESRRLKRELRQQSAQQSRAQAHAEHETQLALLAASHAERRDRADEQLAALQEKLTAEAAARKREYEAKRAEARAKILEMEAGEKAEVEQQIKDRMSRYDQRMAELKKEEEKEEAAAAAEANEAAAAAAAAAAAEKPATVSPKVIPATTPTVAAPAADAKPVAPRSPVLAPRTPPAAPSAVALASQAAAARQKQKMAERYKAIADRRRALMEEENKRKNDDARAIAETKRRAQERQDLLRQEMERQEKERQAEADKRLAALKQQQSDEQSKATAALAAATAASAAPSTPSSTASTAATPTASAGTATSPSPAATPTAKS